MITELTAEHRHCDDLFAALEAAMDKENFEKAKTLFAEYEKEVLEHFDVEEQKLFPAFEARTGMTSGPTMVMRMEHSQIRGLLAEMKDAIFHGQPEIFFSIAETLLIMTQQHNMKEENVLYPMCELHLGADFLNDEKNAVLHH